MKHLLIFGNEVRGVYDMPIDGPLGPGYSTATVPVDAGPQRGDRLVDGELIRMNYDGPPPAEASTTANYRKVLTRTEYYGQFTAPEEAVIRITASEPVTAAALAAADEAEQARLLAVASLAVMLRRTDAMAPDGKIELGNPQVQAGLDLLVTMGLLTQARRDEIALGVEEA